MSTSIGVDLGGTATRVVALDEGGTTRTERRIRTPGAGTAADEAIAVLARLIREVAGDSPLRAIGIGASGPIDAAGIIRNDDTLPAYSHLPVTDHLAEAFGVRCVIDNDAVTAAVGEHAHGSGQGSDGLLMVTLGTGVGVSVLKSGRPVRALDGTHPEAGHIPVPGPAAPCYCGLATCWEQVASRTALDQLTAGRTQQVAAAARDGDAGASQLLYEYGTRVGIGVATLQTIFRPDRLVLGGSAADFFELFRGGMDAALERQPGFAPPVTYRTTSLGDFAGAVGAAVLAANGI
jgi:glucokinase